MKTPPIKALETQLTKLRNPRVGRTKEHKLIAIITIAILPLAAEPKVGQHRVENKLLISILSHFKSRDQIGTNTSRPRTNVPQKLANEKQKTSHS